MPAPAPKRVLAVAATSQGWLVVSAGLLSWQAPTWRSVGWHEIEHGGWNDDLHELYWTRYEGGRRERVHLDRPGRVPELFNERVQASIVFVHTVPVTESHGIVVSARRNLVDPSARLEWHTSLQRGLTWADPGVREAADAALARFAAEYDPS